MSTKVTYLSHSGFMVVVDNTILVFDYLHDPANALEKELKAHPDYPVVFFVTHNHKDHFVPRIFEIAQNHKRYYVVSNDVPAKVIPSTLDVAGMSAGDVIDNLPASLTVKAYPSTDRGVSFMVTTLEGEKIFHAGDLNNWQWIDEMTTKQMQQAETKFKSAVHRIAEENPVANIVFFPVDTRLGADAGEGAKYFMTQVKTENFFPMHFNGDYRTACDFPSYATSDTDCHCLHTPGQSVTLTAVNA